MALKKWKWRGFDPKKGTQAEVEEYIRDMKEATVECQKAIETVQAFLNDKEAWFEAEVLAVELNDALDDMRESIRELEEKFRDLKIRPGWMHLWEGEALVWNGTALMVETANGLTQLTSIGKERRILAFGCIPDLYEELTRPRLKEPLPKRQYSSPRATSRI
jgi:hypothetical protein